MSTRVRKQLQYTKDVFVFPANSEECQSHHPKQTSVACSASTPAFQSLYNKHLYIRKKANEVAAVSVSVRADLHKEIKTIARRRDTAQIRSGKPVR